MGKKRFDKTNKRRKKLTREDDGAVRLTHLWAAAHLIAEQAPSLSRHYITTTRQICRRINLKTDFITIKRHLCKHCNTLLIPGLGHTPPRIRHVATPQPHLRIVCGRCGSVKRFLSCRRGGKCVVREVEGGGECGDGSDARVEKRRNCVLQ